MTMAAEVEVGWVVERQQVQIDRLAAGLDLACEELAALKDCLQAVGALRIQQLDASVHRRRFQRLLLRVPADWDARLTDVARVPGVLHPMLRFAGVQSLGCLASCARALRSSTEVSQRYTGRPTRIYLLGGSMGKGSHSPCASAMRLDLSRSRWENLPPMPSSRDVLAAAAGESDGGMVYAVGGSDGTVALATSARYDAESSSWEPLDPMPTARGGLAVAVVAGRVYAVGGSDGLNALNCVEYYDIDMEQWHHGPSLREARRGVAMAATDRHLIVFGGSNGATTLNSVESLDTFIGLSWEQLADMGTPRRAAAATCLGRHAYIAGGAGGLSQSDPSLSDFERLDLETGVWERLPPMPTARRGLALLAAEGLLFALGGSDGVDAVSALEVFDPMRDAWEERAPMPIKRAYFGAAATQTLEVMGLTQAVGGQGFSEALRQAREAMSPWSPQESRAQSPQDGASTVHSVL